KILAMWTNIPNQGPGVYLLEIADGRIQRFLEEPAHHSSYTDLSWSKDGRSLASAICSTMARAESVRVWDVSSGKLVRETRKDVKDAGVAWSPDGELLACNAYGSGDVRLYEAHTGRLLQTVSHAKYPSSNLVIRAVWSPDSKILATWETHNIPY